MTPTPRPTPLPATGRLVAAATLAGLALACLASPALALQSKAQQACILTVHKAFAAVAKAEAREAASCLKAAALGDLVQPTVVDCIASDVRSKVAAARAKAAARVQGKCKESLDFGPADSTGAAAVAAAGGARVEILEALLGDDLDAALATRTGDRDAASCQAAVVKSVDRCWKARVAGYAKCAAAGLDAWIEDVDALAACRDLDADGKIAKACVAGVQSALQKKCDGVDLDVRLPGCTCRYPRDCVTITVANATNARLSQAQGLPPAATVLPDVRVAQAAAGEPWMSPVHGEFVASHVIGREADAPLACPLGAVNIYTVQDPVADSEYNWEILPLLLQQGVRVLYSSTSPVDLLGDSPANLVQGHQAMPLYSAATDFLRLSTRRETFDLVELKHAQVGSTLHFGFEHCLHDCDAIYASVFSPLNDPPFIFGTRLVIHHFSADRETIEGAVAGLAAEAELAPGVRLAWAGRAVADFKIELADGSVVQSFNSLPVDGSLVYQLDPGVDPLTDLLPLPVLGAFLDATTSDAMMLVE